MKLLRYGPLGQEKPGILDASGAIRDLSGVVPDITGDVLSPAALAKIAAVDVNEEFDLHRAELCRSRGGNRRANPEGTDCVPEIAQCSARAE